jgi:PhnB protein
MPQVNGYFTFNGNCREAMNFYQQCIGGDLQLQTIGASPMANKMPPHMREYILHATLTGEDFVLMGSDMVPQQGLVKGNGVSLVIGCSSEAALRSTYQSLCAGGEATHPVESSFWGALFGGLTDRYQNNWLLHFHPGGNQAGNL